MSGATKKKCKTTYFSSTGVSDFSENNRYENQNKLKRKKNNMKFAFAQIKNLNLNGIQWNEMKCKRKQNE